MLELAPVVKVLFILMINTPSPLKVSVPFKLVGSALVWQKTPEGDPIALDDVSICPPPKTVPIVFVVLQGAASSELYKFTTSMAADMDSGVLGARIAPINVAPVGGGSNPLIAPPLVPTSPVIVDEAAAVIAPTLVNRAKLTVVPKLGALVCPKLIFVNANRVATIEKRVQVFFIVVKC